MKMGTRKGIEAAAAALKEFGAQEVYVFGSAADGTMHEDSDIDLAVSGLPPEVFFRAMAQARGALGRELDLIDLDEETLFTEYLKKKGKLRRVA
jgi:predicted nucleotidyltransferase